MLIAGQEIREGVETTFGGDPGQAVWDATLGTIGGVTDTVLEHPFATSFKQAYEIAESIRTESDDRSRELLKFVNHQMGRLVPSIIFQAAKLQDKEKKLSLRQYVRRGDYV